MVLQNQLCACLYFALKTLQYAVLYNHMILYPYLLPLRPALFVFMLPLYVTLLHLSIPFSPFFVCLLLFLLTLTSNQCIIIVRKEDING